MTRESPATKNTTTEISSQEESRDSHFAPSATINTPVVVVKPKGKGRQIKEKAWKNSKVTKQRKEKQQQSDDIDINEKVNQVIVSKSMKNRKK